MRTNTQEALLPAYIESIGKRTRRCSGRRRTLQTRELAQSFERDRL
jgi:hypothetical protein